jgi:hypothetical protein
MLESYLSLLKAKIGDVSHQFERAER